MRRPATLASALVGALTVFVGCGSGSDDTDTDDATTVPVEAERCVLWLHGRSERGAPTELVDGVAHVRPDGNATAGPGREWRYAQPDDLAAANTIVRDAVDAASCQHVAVHGFSNGAAFAAKLYCSGDDLDGRLRGVVIDDPVTDASAADCAPADGVEGVLYWTTALAEQGAPGTECAEIGWTCEGPVVVGIDAYSESLGLPITPSIHTDHLVYADPPELELWLAAS
jgi:hypothetical protein